ncbi:hypothetical protein PLICRDRAFT_35094 [Plicaturopsis crispa FD-325 SS-3]|nr:hypothetical protein PLICRDRAFT_35094 [Plicaturopsis crispa FD-325 SS-3]
MQSISRILTPGYLLDFQKGLFSYSEERYAIDMLRDFIYVFPRDDPQEQLHVLREANVIDPETPYDVTSPKFQQLANVQQLMWYWQLVQFYRWSRPTRIAEAEYSIKTILSGWPAPPYLMGEPRICYAVCLEKSPRDAERERALEAFYDAWRYCDESTHEDVYGEHSDTVLWGRASMSRLLRRMGKIEEAEQQENAIRQWLLTYPRAHYPQYVRMLVIDPRNRGQDYILDHPDTRATWGPPILRQAPPPQGLPLPAPTT